jgi:two-component system CheB/CheR fusion protein
MAELETVRGDALAELRAVNEQLLIAGLREQELAAALEAERAQLAVILAGIGDAVLVVDQAGTIMRANAAYARLAGGADLPLAPEDEREQRLPPDQTPRARAARGETFNLEFTLPAADGSRSWFEAKGQPLGDHSAGLAVVVIRDITLSSLHRRLQDDFLALAGHELRTPLTAIQGCIDLLGRWCRASDDERVPTTIATARHQAQRLRTLVNDLMDVARLQSGKLTLTWGVVDLRALAAETVAIARGLTEVHAISIDAPAEPLPVRGDANRLEQVLLNLLTNALQHTPPATPIEVRLRREGGEITLAVHDDGLGIPADLLPHLLERFYQVARHDRGSQEGMGLGLFLAHQLVEAHGGRLAVASAPEEGTTFTVWLPAG